MREDVRTLTFDEHLGLIRDFTRDRLIPAEEEVEERDAVPSDIVQEMRDLGLFGISIPRRYGGLGWTQEQQVLLTLEFTRASAAYRSRFSTTIGLTSQVLLDHGTDAQRERHLPAMAAGERTGAFALTETEAGSDAGAVTTTATRLPDGGYRLNGRKRYITNAPEADLFLVAARTGEPGSGSAGLSVLLVERGTPGLTTPPHTRLLGQRGSHVGEVHLDDCHVPADALLGAVEGQGLKRMLRGINHARTHVAATCVGQADRLVAEATRYALGREQFGRPVAEFQSVANLLAQSQAELLAGRAMVLDCARAFDRAVADGTAIPAAEIAAAKYFCSETVWQIADRAVQVLGGAGYVENNPVTRIFRDVRLFRLFEGTSQIQLRSIAADLKRRHTPAP